MEKLKGLIAAPFTPMDEMGEINFSKIETLIQLYEKNNVKGAFVSGSTGEGVSLSYEEKRLLIKEWGKAKSTSFRSLIMLGGTCLKEMQQLAIHAQDCQMDGISILCPYYFRPGSVEALVSFCKQITDTVPEMPFYYYHIPALTGGNFSMPKFLELADEQIPSLAGIKYTATNVMDYHLCRMYKSGKYDILWGVDEALLSGLAVGAEGAVGSTYNYAAPLYNQIFEAFHNGNLSKAEHLQQQAVKMVELLVKYGGTEAGKAFMKLIGVDCGWFRPPLSRPSDEEVEELKKELTEINFFDFCSKP